MAEAGLGVELIAMTKRVNTADFIECARKVHGERYDYSQSVYVAAKTKVTIICPDHGPFQQQPSNHYLGRGCQKCGGNRPLTIQEFVERSFQVHGTRYDYSGVDLKNVESKVEIRCLEHGPFLQRPASHLKGFGCRRCGRVETAKRLRHSLERFLNDARRAHGDKYDYSQATYINALSKVIIVCPDHGPFRQKPANHIREVGCPRCGDESTAAKRTRSTEEFVSEAFDVHGDRYDYSKVAYTSSHVKVEIVCRQHGPFWQSPVNHVRGNQAGCPSCAESGFKPSEPGLLYYLAVTANDGKTLYKIGITNLTVERRFAGHDLSRIRTICTWKFDVGREAAEREAEILREFSIDRYLGPDVLMSAGNTELFIRDVLGLDRLRQGSTGAIVDGTARLVFRPTQLGFDFRDRT